MKETLTQFLKYNFIGIINTFIGFSIVFSLMFLGLSAVWSNFVGYFFGAIVSYNLNKRYTFKDRQSSKMQIVKFFSVLGIAYLLNLLTLVMLLESSNPYLAQIIAAIVYTLSSFILAKVFVFKRENV